MSHYEDIMRATLNGSHALMTVKCSQMKRLNKEIEECDDLARRNVIANQRNELIASVLKHNRVVSTILDTLMETILTQYRQFTAKQHAELDRIYDDCEMNSWVNRDGLRFENLGDFDRLQENRRISQEALVTFNRHTRMCETAHDMLLTLFSEFLA